VGLWSPFEQTNQEFVIYHAQKRSNYRPNEHATDPVRGYSDDIVSGKSNEGATTNARIRKDQGNQRREGENNAAQLAAETAGSTDGIAKNKDQLASRVVFPIEIVKVRKCFHRQAVFVFFACDALFHQMLRKPLTGSLSLRTVCKNAVYAKRAIDG
jgi:hypothetical protein